MAWSLSDTADLVGTISNTLTFFIGVAGIVAVWRNRKHLPALSQWLRRNYLTERVRRVRDTLDKLKELNFDDKPNRLQINALMGELAGQFHGLPLEDPAVAKAVAEIERWHGKERNSEAKKRMIVELARVALDGCLMESDINFTSRSNESR